MLAAEGADAEPRHLELRLRFCGVDPRRRLRGERPELGRQRGRSVQLHSVRLGEQGKHPVPVEVVRVLVGDQDGGGPSRACSTSEKLPGSIASTWPFFFEPDTGVGEFCQLHGTSPNRDRAEGGMGPRRPGESGLLVGWKEPPGVQNQQQGAEADMSVPSAKPPAQRRGPEQRVTSQRVAVDTALDNLEDFVSTQELHRMLQDRGDPVSLATTYRILQSMADDGLVDVLRNGEGEAVYRRCAVDRPPPSPAVPQLRQGRGGGGSGGGKLGGADRQGARLHRGGAHGGDLRPVPRLHRRARQPRCAQ